MKLHGVRGKISGNRIKVFFGLQQLNMKRESGVRDVHFTVGLNARVFSVSDLLKSTCNGSKWGRYYKGRCTKNKWSE